MDPVRIGVMGCADIARRRMLPAMTATHEAKIVAIASRDLARATELARDYGCRAVQGYDALLTDPSVQAVYIPLPASIHAMWTEAALRAGKHVLVEKPLSLEYTRTAALLKLAHEAGMALMENVMFVHHGQHAVVREMAENGVVGELRAFQAAFTVPERPAADIRRRPDLGGGALWDTGVYPVRAASYFLGPGLRVAGSILTAGSGYQVDSGGEALLITPDGAGAQLSFGIDHSYRSAYIIWGSRGSITVDRSFTPPADRRPVIRLAVRGEVRELRLPAEDQAANTVSAFARAVRGGGVSSRESLEQARLLEGIRMMAVKGPEPGRSANGAA